MWILSQQDTVAVRGLVMSSRNRSVKTGGSLVMTVRRQSKAMQKLESHIFQCPVTTCYSHHPPVPTTWKQAAIPKRAIPTLDQ